VRAVVPNVDDPSIPVNTLRAWLLGFVLAMVGAGINQFFSLQYPGIKIVSLVAELLAYPIGVLLAKLLPVYSLNLGPWGIWCINPDHHFNIKEHALITIMSNVSFGFGSADATDIIQAAAKFYNFDVPPGLSTLLVLVCQLAGFGVAGLCSTWLVEPASIIWPGVLSNIALLTTLHSKLNVVANGWRISRLRFFLYVTFAAGIWYFFPSLIFEGLGYFTWLCWIMPDNLVVNHLFGMVTGLGMNLITFDWAQIAYNSNPLLSPSWAAINVFAGFAIFFWIVTPAIYYTNTWFTAYLPLMSSEVYDNTAQVYNVSRILNADNTFNLSSYENYSPAYLPAPFALVHGLAFAAVTALPVHIYLWHGTQVRDGFTGHTKRDIHARLMRNNYLPVPRWWFAFLTLGLLAMAIALVEGYDTQLPWWSILLAFAIALIYFIPCGIIQGITNIEAGQVVVLAQFIAGYLFDGSPLANLIFRVFASDVVGQGLYFAQDMKMGHYLKVPPRTLFFAQGSAAVLGALTQTGTVIWMLNHVDGICEDTQPNGFTCPNGRVAYSTSMIWGAIGPSRFYSPGRIYGPLLHFFWIGALCPIITYLAWKLLSRSQQSSSTRRKGELATNSAPKEKETKSLYWLRLINFPLIFMGTSNVPPATGINYSSWAATNLVFNYFLRRRYFAWWAKYNYVLAAALDTGLALSAIVIFFGVVYPGAAFPEWWGNTVFDGTADGRGVPWLGVPEGGSFGG
jgi:OPT family small oligopeptide transporter